MLVHEASIGDVDDPYIVAGFIADKFWQTEKGMWLLEHLQHPPQYHLESDDSYLGHRLTIRVDLGLDDETYCHLRWGSG